MKHTTTPRLLQHGWQRMLAVILASAILVTGISFSGIMEAFAKQSSGYEIYAEYIEDNAKAVLKGKGENVPEGVTVTGLKDADGNELDPKALEYTVDMNGTYKFTVEYEIMQEVEGGSVIKEETEELSVTVDQIRLPEVLTEAPEVMAVSELKARMANAPAPAAAATKEFIMLSAESEYELGRYNYAGGNVNDDLYRLADLIPPPGTMPNLSYNNRTLKADGVYFTLPDDSNRYPITGLYSLVLDDGTTEWYYNSDDANNTAQDNTHGIDVAVKLDSQATLYATYEIKTGQRRNIQRAFDPADSNGTWNAIFNNSGAYSSAYENEIISFSFTVPVRFEKAQLIVTDNSNNKQIALFDTSAPNGTHKLEQKGSGRTYSGVFLVPAAAAGASNKDITVTFKGTAWSANRTTRRAGFTYPRMHTENQKDSATTGARLGQSAKKGDDLFRLYAALNTDSNLGNDTNEMKVVWREDLGFDRGSEQLYAGWKNSWLTTGARSSFMAYLQPEKGNAVANASKNNYTQAVTVATVDDQIVSTNGKENTIVSSEAGPLRAGTAYYTPGNTQTFKIQYEAGIVGWMSQGNISYRPTSLDLYTYLRTGIYGADPTNNDAVLQENIQLPGKQGESVTYTTQTGGTIKITMSKSTSGNSGWFTNISSRKARSDTDFGKRNMGLTYAAHMDQWHEPVGIFNNWPKDIWFLNDREPRSNAGTISLNYHEYTVTVQNMTYDYLFSFLDDKADESIMRIKSLDGIDASDINKQDPHVEDRTKSSYTYKLPDGSSEGRPLMVGTNLFKSKAKNNFATLDNNLLGTLDAWNIYLKPMMGYSRPTVTIEGGNQPKIAQMEVPEGDTGRYMYSIGINNGIGNNSPVIPQLVAKSYPITFNIKYQTEAGGVSSVSDSLKPATSPNYLVKLPSDIFKAGSNKVLTHYQVKLKNSDGKEYVVRSSNANGTLTGQPLQVKVQEILDLSDVYNFLTRYQYGDRLTTTEEYLKSASNASDAKLNYTLTLVPQFTTSSATQGGYISDTFTLSLQNAFKANDQSVSEGNRDTVYSGNQFTKSPKNFYRLSSDAVVLSAPYLLEHADKAHPKAHYVLSDYSTISLKGTEGSTKNLLKAYYLMGVQVQLTGLENSPTGVTDTGQTDNGQKVYIPTGSEDKWYIGMGGHNSETNDSTVDLSGISATNAKGETLTGWQIVNNGGNAYGTISADNPILDLARLGSTNSTLWTQIFQKDGVLKLNAVYTPNLLPIQSVKGAGGAAAEVWNDQYKHPTVHEYYSGTEIILEGQFKYDFSTRQKILNEWGANGSARTTKAPDAMAQYLDWSLYGISLGDTAAQNTKQVWSLRGSNENGLTGVKTKLELENTDTDGDGYATATITITIPGNQVTYNKLKNQAFYLFAWNDASNTKIGKNYTSTTATDTDDSPFKYIQANAPHSDYGGGNSSSYNNVAVANEYWYYKQMVPRGITNVNDGLSIVTGNQIQWKNVNAQSQSFEVEFKYDNSIPWNVQDSVYDSGNTTDNNAIRVVVARKDKDGTWEKLDRFNPDGTFGNGGQLDNYKIELVAPQSNSNTFKVKVTAENNAMAASADNSGTEFLVVAYNFQNGETTAPVRNDSTTDPLNNTVKMSGIVGDLGTNRVIGQKVPAVKSAVTFYPKGVTLEDGTLSSSTNVSKPYWQPSTQQTAVFTFDNANGTYSTANKNLQDWFSPDRNNYHIGLYKKNGNSWSLVESNDTADADRKYIQGIQINGADGKVTVNYVIPAEENTSNTQYRLIAFYGNIDGKNNIKNNTLASVATNMATASSDLAVVNITMNSSTFQKVVSNSGSLAWNARHSLLERMYNSNATNEGDNFVLTATFKYDINSRDIIQQYWDNKTPDNPTTDEGMGRYLNWAMYGYNPRTGESSTWVIREKNVTGEQGSGIDQKINFTVDLSLGNQADASGYAVATIKIIIPKDEFNYENMSQQALYLFAWNDATNKTVDGYKAKATNYKALMHSDTSGGESPYTFLQSAGVLKPGSFGNNFGGDGPGMAARGPIASTYWYFNIVPRAITQTDDTKADQTQSAEIINGDTNPHTISATFKYDNSIPWQNRQGVDNDSSLAGDRYDIRVGLYKKDYNGTWKPMAVWHGDGGFNAQGGNNYSLDITPDEQAGTFTVTATINSSVLGASYENYGAEYKIIAYNYANYTGTIGTLLSNGTLNAAIGTDIPSNTTTITYLPTGVKVVKSDGTQAISDSMTINKPYMQEASGEVVFTFDNTGYGSYGNNTAFKDQFSPEGTNYKIGMFKQEGNTWTLVEQWEANQGSTVDGYINTVTVRNTEGQVRVAYTIPDSVTSGTYRIMAFYGNINANNVIENNTLESAAANMTAAEQKLASVTFNVTETANGRIQSDPAKRPNGVWNDQYRDTTYNYIYSENGQVDLQLTATFQYDTSSKAFIEQYWNASQDPNSPVKTTDEGMGRYLNWVMYGYNYDTGERSTWVIREQNVTGGKDNVRRIDGLDIDLTLGDDGIATIVVTIPYNEATYDKLSGQIFYFFAWNDATLNYTDDHRRTPTQFKALMHTDTSGQVSPYSKMVKTILDRDGAFNGLGGKSDEASGWGTVPNYYWYIRVKPKKIESVGQTGGTTITDVPEADTVIDTTTNTIQATFKYDNTVPWYLQGNTTKPSNVHGPAFSSAAGNQYAIRIGLYRQDYGSNTWTPVQVFSGDGGFGATNTEKAKYGLTVTPDENAGTFTVTITMKGNALKATYGNFGANYKIIAYNYDNYTNVASSGGSQIGGLLQNGTFKADTIGTKIPASTRKVTYLPKPMTTVGGSGSGGSHTFTQGKETNQEKTLTYTFQGDSGSWTNQAGAANVDMQNLYDHEKGNVIFTLWKRNPSDTQFSFVDSYTGSGTLDTPADAAATDYISGISKGANPGEISLQVHVGTASNIDKAEYRVFAWYVSSNGDGTWTKDKIQDARFAEQNPSGLNNAIPYSTAIITLNLKDANFYINIPSLVQLYDDKGNVVDDQGLNVSSNYAGNSSSVSYKSSLGTGTTIPDIDVYLSDNLKMTDTATQQESDRHSVGIYLMNGKKNNFTMSPGTGGLDESGFVKLGRLSKNTTSPGDDNNPPSGETVDFYLNTLRSTLAGKAHLYSTTLHFHFVVDPDGIINTTP